MAGNTLSIIDSHIHLFAAKHLASLNWTAELPPDHVLNRGNTVTEYKAATSRAPNLKGFVFLETDRKSGLTETEWQNSLDEVAFLARIAEGRPLPNEGHEAADSKLVLGIIPWAPIPAGPQALANYVDKTLQAFPPDKKTLVKGFRYLIQDKPSRTMLQPAFVDSLHWLGNHGFTFDLGVDARSAGIHQLEESCQMMEILYDSGSTLRIIINHFCKPNLRLSAQEAAGNHPHFALWKECIERMASYPNTYMKLSGFFSELPPQDEPDPADISSLITHIQPWISVVFTAFTPSRILFGSDWPVCNVGGPGTEKSWLHWHSLIFAVLDSLELTGEDKAMVWSGTASKAYNII